jgi:hypothetical protein
VGRGGAAAAADDRDAVALDEFTEDRRQRLRLLREDRLAVGALEREPGVGDAVDRDRAVFPKEADGVAHVLRPGGAVEADRVDVQGLERGQHRADVGAEQHLPALGQQGDAALDRHGATERVAGAADAEHRGLELQDVLGGLDDDQVDAALDEPIRLLGEHIDELGEADPAEGGVVAGRQKAGRPDRARDEAALAGRLARDLGGTAVDLERVVREAPLAELQARRLEGVGLHHLGAGLEHGGVHAFDDVRPVEDQRLVAAAGQAIIALEAEVELLKRGAHSAVVDENAAADGVGEVSHPGDANNLDKFVSRLG